MYNSISHQFFFPHPPETVWEYLTNSDLMALWLMKNTFQPILGAEFQFITNPIPNLDFDGIFYCRVLEILPFHTLSYSWDCGPGKGEITLNSVVIWKLQPVETGTEVLLQHNGFEKEENLNFFKGLKKGWIEKLDNIDKLLQAKKHGHSNS